MKARIKATGTIVEVEGLFDVGTALVMVGISKCQNSTSLIILKLLIGSTGVMNWRRLQCKDSVAIHINR